MPRKHSGGFIAEESYWDIGTADRGRDGMSARDAAKRYNDHKHPPIIIEGQPEMLAWLTESQQSSYVPNRDDAIVGGVVEDDATKSMRSIGDLAMYEGLLWVYGPGGLVPLGVGAGCYVDSSGNFQQEISYDVISLVGPTEVTATDVPAVRGGTLIETLGERVGAYTLDPSRYATARSAPYMYARLTCSLVPALEAVSHPDYESVIETFPHRASVRLMQLSAQEQDGVYVTSGLPIPMTFYGTDGSQAVGDLSKIEVSQAGGANISVADSAPFALNLDTRFFMQVFASVHEYTDAEVAELSPGQDADVVRACSACTLDILSVTLEIEGVLGVSPFIDGQGTRYTLSAR